MTLNSKVEQILFTFFITLLFCATIADKAISVYEFFNPPKIIYYVK